MGFAISVVVACEKQYALGEISQRSSPASDTRVGVMKPSAFAAPTSPRRSQLVEAALFVQLHQSSPEAK